MTRDNSEFAAEFTPLLRSSTEEQWPVVRGFLESVGEDPARCAVEDIYPDQGLVIVVVASNGRAFELTTWHDDRDHSRFLIEDSRELDTEGRFHHSDAIHAALALLSEELSDTADPIGVVVEATERFTSAMRTDEDWSPFRGFILERDIDPQVSILVDFVHRLAIDSPPERAGTLYSRGDWFAFNAAEDSPVGRLTTVTEWRRIDEHEARERHGAHVDAALTIAAREGGASAS